MSTTADLNDYSSRVNITGVTIASIPIDIVAQTIGNIAIDIASASMGSIAISINVADIVGNIPIDINAQSMVGNLTVDIAAQSMVGDITVDIAAQSMVGNLSIDIAANSFGNLPIDIVAQTIGNIAISIDAVDVTGNIPIDINAQSMVGDLRIDISSQSMVGNITVDINAQSMVGNITVDINAQTLPQLNVNIAASAVTLNINISSITGGVTFDVNITGSVAINVNATQVGVWNVNAAEVGVWNVNATEVGVWNVNANITGSVAINVNVTGSVAIDIKTSGGVNIIIDQLEQGAYTERRSDIRNDNGVTTPTAPPANRTATTYYGKFFPRGMRGNLVIFWVYCKRTGSGTLTLSYAPHPGMGATGSVTITPGAAWDWKLNFVGEMWNYDSMFIWISACSADVSYGYDTTTPYDGHHSADSGVTWFGDSERIFIRVLIQGETVGDIPVSGTVNTIPIPTETTSAYAVWVDVNPSGSKLLLTIVGPGKSLHIGLDADSKDVGYEIRADGELLKFFTSAYICRSEHWKTNYGDVGVGLGIVLTMYDTENNHFGYAITLPIQWKRTLTITAQNLDDINAHHAGCGVVYLKC